MIVVQLIILFLIFNQHVTGLTCKTGEKVPRNGNGCEPCKPGSYQDHENTSKSCKACTTCDTNHGSEIKERCTRFKNTRCECRKDFVPWDSDSSNCKCAEGFKRIGGECKRCEEGFFITSENSDCKKWKECKSGVKISGTAMSDAICNEPNSDIYSTTLPTSNTITTLRGLITQRPHEGAKTQGMDITTTLRVATSTKKVLPTLPVYPGNHIGMALLIFGIVGLVVLTVVTCKLHITDCWHKQKTVQPMDSLCRTPVEESCNESQTPLKSDYMEP
ncbi:tumor necrosis factor receptor superfamily member 4 isoform X3 [Simochromis diagramma]|uniref:tumor necrosis factor receptor superfamily member 4 isoform X3 n=1 Tax=Simochromis diagramma TaxID=43689 RepID=UPI001A7E5CC4|nr:tumor necrosis factor receptor superfamily member 4 isoform X3 [Simochromis diagramma]XP_039857773.1 tumor necrosis factor receptor superfamily member 4 isoform X3 [Simochromis diagramma]